MLLLRVGWIRPVPGWEGWFTFCSRRVIHLKCATTGLSVCRTQSTRSCQLCWLTASKDSLNCTGCWISPRRASAGCTWHSARCSRCTGLSKQLNFLLTIASNSAATVSNPIRKIQKTVKRNATHQTLLPESTASASLEMMRPVYSIY